MVAPADFRRENAGEGEPYQAMDDPPRGSSDRGTFERLIEDFADRIYNVALRITGNRSDAEDAMQEAFLSAFSAWSSFRGEATPTTWLYRIAVNTALMRVRSRRPVEYLSELVPEDEVQDWSAGVADLAQRSELQ